MGCQSCCVPGPQRVPSHHVLAAVGLMGLSPHHGLVSYSSLLLGTSWKSTARGRSRGKAEVSWGEWREAHGGAASLGTRNLYSPSRSLPLSCSLGLPGCGQHGHLGHLEGVTSQPVCKPGSPSFSRRWPCLCDLGTCVSGWTPPPHRGEPGKQWLA